MSFEQSRWSVAYTRLWDWLTFVQSSDPVRYLLNRGLAMIIVILLPISLFAILLSFAADGMGLTLIIIVIILMCLILTWWINRQGTVFGAVLFTLLAIFAIVSAAAPANYTQPNAPVPLQLIIPVIFASLFIRPQAAFWASVLLMIGFGIQLALFHIPLINATRFLILSTTNLTVISVLLMVGTSIFWRALQGTIAANKALEQENRERIQAEQALRQSESQFRAILEASPIPLVITDYSDGEILYANAHVSALLGVAVETIVGKKAAELYYKPEEWAITYAQLLTEGLTHAIELPWRRLDGTSFWLSLSADRITFDGQDALITGFYDITERKAMEASLVQLNTDLEQRVDQRTAELIVANERLQEFDKLKSKFVADVSHELRTPVTNLGLRLYLLEQTPQKLSEHLAILKENVQRLTNLIESVLDLSRLDLNERTVAFGPVDLNAIIERESVGHLLPKQDAELNILYDLDKSLPPVRGEASQIGQVITNLVSNALRYTQAGTVQVRTSFASDSNAVCLEIIDSGIGIEPADMVHLFDRFYRGRNAVRSSIPGTGLGLSIVKDIVDLHEGRIEVESQPGQGSTFRVWLPVMPVIETAAADNL
ncbi:MAG: ATP-binding protein [Chloroflexota bacterium]